MKQKEFKQIIDHLNMLRDSRTSHEVTLMGCHYKIKGKTYVVDKSKIKPFKPDRYQMVYTGNGKFKPNIPTRFQLSELYGSELKAAIAIQSQLEQAGSDLEPSVVEASREMIDLLLKGIEIYEEKTSRRLWNSTEKRWIEVADGVQYIACGIQCNAASIYLDGKDLPDIQFFNKYGREPKCYLVKEHIDELKKHCNVVIKKTYE